MCDVGAGGPLRHTHIYTRPQCVDIVDTLCYILFDFVFGGIIKGDDDYMRKNKQYHFTLPDVVLEEMDELIKGDSISYPNRSYVVSQAIHAYYEMMNKQRKDKKR